MIKEGEIHLGDSVYKIADGGGGNKTDPNAPENKYKVQEEYKYYDITFFDKIAQIGKYFFRNGKIKIDMTFLPLDNSEEDVVENFDEEEGRDYSIYFTRPKKRRKAEFTHWWTTEKKYQLREQGYKQVKGMVHHDSLIWMFTPVFIKMDGMCKIDIDETNSKSMPMPLTTATRLNDIMKSNAIADFIKGLIKGSANKMDTQTMIMMGIIGVGAVFGMHMMGLF